jgi:Tol biopolymer transport system component
MVALAGCRVNFDEHDPLDATTEPLGAWSAPVKLPGQSESIDEQDPALSHDGLELVYSLQPSNVEGQLYVRTRSSRDDPFGPPVPMDINLANTKQSEPRFSPDALRLYFGSNSGTSYGVFYVDRADRTSAWGPRNAVTGLDTPGIDKWLSPCADGNYVVIHQPDVATPEHLSQGNLSDFSETLATELNVAGARSTSPWLSPDCKTVYFTSGRLGSLDIFISHRDAVGQPWSAAEPVSEVAVPGLIESDSALTADQREMAMIIDVNGVSADIYILER